MTAMTVLPSAWTSLDVALRAHRPVWVSYHGRRRLICPHALGWKNHRLMVLGYQTGGDTSTGHLDPDLKKRWRCLYLDQIDHIAYADPASRWASADNYDPGRPFSAIDELLIAATADRADPSPQPKFARTGHATCGT